jgi:hypothetical protein
MKHSALVMVNSSYQLMCALEYLLEAGCHQQALIVSSEAVDSISYKQMAKLASDFGIEHIESINLVQHGSLEQRIGSYGEYFAKTLRYLEFEHLLVGDIRHQWIQDFACSVNANHVYMVDDGGAVLSVIKHILAPQQYYLPYFANSSATSHRQQLATTIKESFGMYMKPKQLALYTIFYQQTYTHVRRNHFSRTLSYYNPQQNFATINEAHIIGAPFVEHNFLIMHDYLDYLKCLAQHLNKLPDLKLVYFMHRFENKHDDKAQALQDLGFELRFGDINYELTLIQSGQKPLAVASVISTSLYNVKAIFGDAVDALFVPLKQQHIDLFKQTNWMVDKYTLSQHWQNIIDNFPQYGVLPVAQWSRKHV